MAHPSLDGYVHSSLHFKTRCSRNKQPKNGQGKVLDSGKDFHMILVKRLDLVRRSGRVNSREHSACVLFYPYNTETKEHQVKMNENKFKTNKKRKNSVSYAAHNQVMELIASYKTSLIYVFIKIQKRLVIGIDNQNNKLQQKDKNMVEHVPSINCLR